jgi:hypothetical protein
MSGSQSGDKQSIAMAVLTALWSQAYTETGRAAVRDPDTLLSTLIDDGMSRLNASEFAQDVMVLAMMTLDLILDEGAKAKPQAGARKSEPKSKVVYRPVFVRTEPQNAEGDSTTTIIVAPVSQ